MIDLRHVAGNGFATEASRWTNYGFDVQACTAITINVKNCLQHNTKQDTIEETDVSFTIFFTSPSFCCFTIKTTLTFKKKKHKK